jgi:hypothetical protein
MKIVSFVLVFLLTFLASAYGQQNPVVIENPWLRYTISAEGRNQEFLDRTTGINYLNQDAHSFCARVRKDGQEYAATAVSRAGDRLTIQFGQTGVEAILGVESRNSYIRLTVKSVSGGEIDSLVFLYVPLILKGRPEEPFGACAFSLNLNTRVDQLPALQTELQASCYQKFGMEGAKVAIIGTPMAGMLPALKEVLTEAGEMSHCPVAGPWANEIPFNHGSYLFNFGTLTESTAEEWIGMAKSLGVTQIDNHGGSASFFRFGDFTLNQEKWPEGWQTYRRIVKQLHDAGIGSIFHTYAFFIDKQSKYVTPIPDSRLDAFQIFTLREAVTPDTNEILVNESTKNMGTVTGFFEHNSVVLHIGDELITFGGVTKEPPWKFTQVTRGVFGTKPADHEKNAKARQLKECFGLFVPDPESSLFEEIAKNHAEVVNECDFDGIYLDAIDGSSILRGPDECWYWADKFVFEIQKHLKKPVGMEMSAMWHHFWQYRTRWQAWDYPRRGQKRFIDIHAATVNGGLLLPLHLGWWNFHSFDPPQVEPSYSDVVEYLGAKLIGWDAGISLTGAINQESLKAVPLFRRAVDTLRTCEDLRHAGIFDGAVKARLRETGKDFSLFQDGQGQWRFRPAQYDGHTVAASEPWSQSWSTVNSFADQPVKLRIEALMSAQSYDYPENIVLATLSPPIQAENSSSTNPNHNFGSSQDTRNMKLYNNVITTPDVSGIRVWQYDPVSAYNAPCVMKNTTEAALMNGWIPAGMAALHPAYQPFAVPGREDMSLVRWTAPQTGEYQVNTMFHAGGPGLCDYYVVQNYTTVLFAQLDQSGSARFDATVTLPAGNTLDFAVGAGTDNSGMDVVPLEVHIVSSTDPAAAWDVATDMSFTENPNGAWSYGSAAAFISSDPKAFTGRPLVAEGVTVQREPAAINTPGAGGVLTAMNSGKVPQNGAWARLDWKFNPALNLSNHQAIGVWVEGDGRGEIIAIRLESPQHISFGAIADRYITVDFIGRRFFTLVETEAARWSDYIWNDGKWLYNAYRETINFGVVESMGLMYNNLPPNQEVRCTIGAVKALPMVPCSIKNPAVTVNGKTISFPVEIPSGGFLEFYNVDNCTLYGPTGETIGKVTPSESAPILQEGTNSVQFTCDPTDPAPRAKIVVISYGDPL